VVSLAHKFAFESPLITAEAISAVAMIELAQSYKIFGTPHIVLNRLDHLTGRVTEAELLTAITKRRSEQ
jgi:hypothetical protein